MATFAGRMVAERVPLPAQRTGFLDVMETAQTYPRLGDFDMTLRDGTRSQESQSENPITRNGYLLFTMYDLFYQGIYLIPTELDVGNLVQTKTFTFMIWNAEFTPHVLESIDGFNTDGLTLQSIALPLTFGRLAVKEFTLTADAQGSPAVNASYVFGFNDVPDLTMKVTGRRLVAWTFNANWADGVTERLGWLTNILSGDFGYEQRRALRISPRREFEFSCLLANQDRQYFEIVTAAWGGRTWLLPVWPDVQQLAMPASNGSNRVNVNTLNRDFAVGGYVLLRGPNARDFDAAEIESMDATGLNLIGQLDRDWPITTKVYPARVARLVRQPEVQRLTDRAQNAGVHFILDGASDWPEAGPTATYQGRPLYDKRPNESENLTRTYLRLLAETDNSVGPPAVKDPSDREFMVLSYRWFIHSAEMSAQIRSLLYYFRGRQKTAWIPTYGDDLTIKNPILGANIYIEVEWIGYTQFGSAGKKDIRLELRTGEVFYRRVVDSQEIEDGERLFLDESLAIDCNPEDVLQVSWMICARLDQDNIEIKHETDINGLSLCQVIFKEVRDHEL